MIMKKHVKLKIKVKANSRENKVEDKGDYYLVSVKEKAKENKANLAVIKLLSKYFKKKVRIVKGLRSKDKIVEFI